MRRSVGLTSLINLDLPYPVCVSVMVENRNSSLIRNSSNSIYFESFVFVSPYPFILLAAIRPLHFSGIDWADGKLARILKKKLQGTSRDEIDAIDATLAAVIHTIARCEITGTNVNIVE